MTAPEFPAGTAIGRGAAVPAGASDADDLAAILNDDHEIARLAEDIEAHRQAIVDRHGIDAFGPMMLSLSRLSGAAEQITVEIRFIRRFLGEA